MSRLATEHIIWPLLAATLLLLSCFVVTVTGTLDVHTWTRWTNDYLTLGPVAGYAASNTDYPPLMAFIFYVFASVLSFYGIAGYLAIKIAVLVCYGFTAALVYLWTYCWRSTACYMAAFFLDAALLGYTDIILGFGLLLALYALRKNSLIIFAAIFTVSVFIKWQVLIVAPFLAIYVLYHYKANARFFWHCMLPAGVVAATIILIFGAQRLLFTFAWALHHQWLSANAYNFPWILTWAYRFFSPQTFGGLIQGEIIFISTSSPPAAFLISKGIFISLYLGSLLAFFRSKKQFLQLLQYCLLGYLVYFVFNLGVHENHLFLSVLLAIIISHLQPAWGKFTLYLAIAFNLNLLFSYGITGHASLPHVINGNVDITVLLAAATTLFACYLFYKQVSIASAT